MRKNIEKKINVTLLVLFAITVIGEAVYVAYGTSHNSLDLLSIGFGMAMLTVLLMDIPVFLLVSVVTSTVKEIYLFLRDSRKEKTRLILSSASATASAVTLILFFTLGRVTDSTANDRIYFATLLCAFASAVLYTVYIIVNRKKGL